MHIIIIMWQIKYCMYTLNSNEIVHNYTIRNVIVKFIKFYSVLRKIMEDSVNHACIRSWPLNPEPQVKQNY